MKIRATKATQWQGLDSSWVSGRFEIQWNDNEQFVNLGIVPMPELEWLLLLSICAVGAHRAGIDFEYAAPPVSTT